ncbi:uncharacterized protein LOC125668174 isoform X2 [Ostrea edulis]|uniref:uncharacterized protein LOC125668174 isoform X2 n=1 Tax=Ostrea edulis TaxID=37623 RepID=UPI0024AF4B9C|nr:uncharacterized protein LOC125668174 isoform X2 [Ostrea edulis]
MYWSLRLFLVVITISVADCKGLCGNRDNGCCSGQIWNETLKMCTDCAVGYTGRFCDIRCHYPYYGMLCQMKCSSPHSRDQYDFKTGCVHTGRMSRVKNSLGM